MQLRRTGVVVVQPLLRERFKIQKMACIFLDRPFVIRPAGEGFRRHSDYGSSKPIRRLPQALEQCGPASGARPSSNVRSNHRDDFVIYRR